ncbi:DUF885 domain-containing protein [Lentiprolixibacter aurantiacus]|uniref:DUF885 domain-containing protein n=1 Tax=Lentiprolixibacter aurantiacus TaxID=2993939 RepID=A0AAE3MJE8_9FLAO|nr:DUF885 domain-containing protein [Lentiprolixibacter aurantiacus]MCX2718885.1 DUF885 domain-containing protein [Lentiprolixibacter aurantiacus]
MRANFLFFLMIMGLCPLQGQDSLAHQNKLHAIIEAVDDFRAYDRKEHPLGLYTKARYQKEAAFATEQLNALAQVDPKYLSEGDLISWELLKFTLEDQVDRYALGMYLNPIQADQGFHLNLNFRIRKLSNFDEVKNYLKVLDAIPEFAVQHFALMREGLKNGNIQPRIIFRGYESTYEQHIVSDFRQSLFYKPFQNLPADLNPQQKDSVRQVAKLLIINKVVPAFRDIKQFFEQEYLPKARESIGISSIPGGREFYQNRINFYTTSDRYNARDIHELGKQEVSRIRGEMKEIMKDLGFKGSYDEFLTFLRTSPQFYAETPDKLLMAARDIAKRIDGELPRFFKTLPRRPYGVKPVPDAIAPKYTAGRYVPPRSETQSGTYLVNTYKLKSRTLYTLPALTAHEAMPGHHLQGALNRELSTAFPAFRRQLYLSAFGEGWGLYSEYLAAEMGIYRNPYEKFGQLTYEMWRACRLVVDTGIHALGWTRDQAINYMKNNTALSLHEINTETDRYIGWPGQALAYKIGEITIRELRKEAEKALGSKFNIREFHEVILGEGTVTLPILRRRVANYIREHTDLQDKS